MKKYLFLVFILSACAASSFALSKQQRFFESLLPAVNRAEKRIYTDRQRLKKYHEQTRDTSTLTEKQRKKLYQIVANYGVHPFDFKKDFDWKRLLARVDVVPPSMVLAQAANESAWGQSRFAVLGNNFFGQWCYSPGCGLVPLKRAPGAHHEVKRFKNIEESIASYLHNLNTNRGYQVFRQLREQLRGQHQALSGNTLAQGLINYSERKQLYVKSIRALIRHHKLGRYDNFKNL